MGNCCLLLIKAGNFTKKKVHIKSRHLLVCSFFSCILVLVCFTWIALKGIYCIILRHVPTTAQLMLHVAILFWNWHRNLTEIRVVVKMILNAKVFSRIYKQWEITFLQYFYSSSWLFLFYVIFQKSRNQKRT